jgi:hypothetical protein
MENNLKENFIRSLKKNKIDFGQKIKDFVFENEETIFSICLSMVLTKYEPFGIEQTHVNDIISSTIEDPENPIFDEYNGVYFNLNNIDNVEYEINSSIYLKIDSFFNEKYQCFWSK